MTAKQQVDSPHPEKDTRAFDQEFKKASGRIGHITDDVMRWLLKFIKLDLLSLSAGDFMNLQYEIVFFGCYGPPDLKEHEWIGSPFWPSDKERYLPQIDFVEGLQEWARNSVQYIIDKDPVMFEFDSLRLNLYQDTDNRWKAHYYSNDPIEAIKYSVAQLLIRSANLLRQCPECHRHFLADRKNQEYCSLLCQGRVTTRRYRISHNLITGRKRGRPRKEKPQEKKVLKKKGTSRKKSTKRAEVKHGKKRKG